MSLTDRDRERLNGVHPDLIRVLEAAADMTFLRWFVNEGVRSPERQKKLFDDGKTLTMNSPHFLRSPVGAAPGVKFGFAVDLVLLTSKGAADWTPKNYYPLAAEVLQSASRLRTPVKWGGFFRDGDGKRFFDGLHFELDSGAYPRN